MSDNSVDVELPGPTYRVPRRRGMDPGTRRLAIIAGGLGGALLLILGIWSVGGDRQRGTVPVIEADTRPLRVKPDNPGGLQVAGAHDDVLTADDGPQSGKLLPPPEAPAPNALKDQTPGRPAEPLAAGPDRLAGPPTVPPQTAPSPLPAAVRSIPAEPSDAAPKAATSLAKPASVAAAAPASRSGKATQVQLAALETEQAALAEWRRLARRMPDVLAGREPAVIRAEHDGRTIWRLRTGGFADIAQATAFCERVRSKGAGCSVAAF